MNTNISYQSAVHAVLVAAFTMSFAHHTDAQADNAFREQPRGAGTETGDDRVGEGCDQSKVQLAVGYGFGVGGRVGHVPGCLPLRSRIRVRGSEGLRYT
jgi:hypothetical protein